MKEQIIPEKTYVAVFVALLVLTLGTYEAAKLNLGHWNAPIGVAIAAVKAMLVVVYFMHVRYSSWLIRIVIVTGLLWLSILIGLTMNDYVTRAW
jgi:cytochrome c oxidase subunit 4